jgi:hypothetical protein
MRLLLISMLVGLGCCSKAKAPAPRVTLPSRELFITDILGKSRRDLDTLLATAATTELDGRASYAIETTHLIVLFDNDRAAMVSIAPAHYVPDDANVDRVLAWLHADRTKLQVETGDTVDLWNPPMHDRQLLRDAAARELGLAASFSKLDLQGATCEAVQQKLQLHPDLDLHKLGFTALECTGAQPVR